MLSSVSVHQHSCAVARGRMWVLKCGLEMVGASFWAGVLLTEKMETIQCLQRLANLFGWGI